MIKQTWKMAMLIILLPNLYRAMALETTNHNLISMLEVKFQHNSDAVKCCRRLKRNKTFRPHSIPKITTETAEKTATTTIQRTK